MNKSTTVLALLGLLVDAKVVLEKITVEEAGLSEDNKAAADAVLAQIRQDVFEGRE